MSKTKFRENIKIDDKDKNQEQGSQNEKRGKYSEGTRMLTREEGTALCRRIAKKGEEYLKYMRKMEAQKAEQNKNTSC